MYRKRNAKSHAILLAEARIVNLLKTGGAILANRDKTLHILALDGGGARGIYSALMLAKIEDAACAPVRDCFDLIAGTSAGAISAGAAAIGVPMPQIVDLFETESERIFRKRRFSGFGLFQSKYSRNRLKRAVEGVAGDVKLGDIESPLMITGSNISTGGVYVFKSAYLRDMGHQYVRDGETLLSEAILASCAAPSYFDPARVGDSLVADGGLWANNPSIIALAEALAKFRAEIERVHILSIGTGRSTNFYSKSKSWGLFTGWGRQKLVSYFLSLQSQASTNMSKLILEDRHLRLDPEIGDWGLDDAAHIPNMKSLANDDFADQSQAILNTLRRPE